MINTLIDEIEKVRIKHGLTNGRLADVLNIDRGHWSRVRRGKTPFGHKTLSALSRNFPELDLGIMQYIKGSDERTNDI